MNSETVNGNDSPTPGNLFDEFEDAFQNCLAPLIKDDPLNEVSIDELRTNAEVNVPKFLELAHRMDAAFLQKRFLLSVQKPELLIMEENHEMRVEMGRKDELIKKQTDKLTEWQSTLLNLITRVGSVPPTPSNRSPIQGGLISTSHGSASHVNQVTSTSAASLSNLGVSPMSQTSSVVSASQSVGVPSSSMSNVNRQNIMGVQGPGVNFQPMSGRGHAQNVHGSGGSHMGPTPSPQGGCQPPPTAAGSNIFSSLSSSVSNLGQPPLMQGGGGLQGPLAYLEKTTTNIGMPDQKR